MKKLFLFLSGLLLCAAGLSAQEPLTWDCGAEGNNVTATLTFVGDGATLTLSGTGAMADYNFFGTPWASYSYNITSVVINDGITHIGNCAFYACQLNQGQVSLPNSVVSIGNNAFAESGLDFGIHLGNGLKTIGSEAFRSCHFASINLPEGLTDIGDAAFNYCSELQSIAFPNSLNSLGESAFEGCSQLSSIDFGSGLTTVSERAFANCSGLSEVILPDNITTLEESAFSDCSGLTSITAGKNLTNIGQYVFEDCSGLVAINVAAGNTTFASQGGVLFSTDMENLILCPVGKTGAYAIPNGVISIADMAFLGSGISSVIFPNSVTTIGMGAFGMCMELASVTLGSSITTLNGAAFAGCSKLAAINVAAGNTAFSSVDGVLFNADKTTLVQYPAGKQDEVYTVPNSVGTIGIGAFMWCRMTGVNFPEGLTTIGEFAFQVCENLTSITLPESLVNLGDEAFSGCTELTSVTLPSGLIKLSNGVFGDCQNLTSINLPAGLKSIGENAFGYSGLTGITFPEGLETIGESAFSGCNAISVVTLPASLDSIGRYVFNINNLKKIICLNPTPFQIGTTAFGYVDGYRSIRIEVPQSSVDQYKAAWSTYAPYITYTGAPMAWNCGYNEFDYTPTDAVIATLSNDTLYINGEGRMAEFGGQSPWYAESVNITTVVIGDGVTNVSSYCFSFHKNLTSVVIGNDVETIGYQAFSGCSALTNVNLSEGLRYIADYAFMGCTSLTEFNLPASIDGFFVNVFDGCNALLNINIAEGNPTLASIDGVVTDFNKETLLLYPKGRTGAYTIPEGITTIGGSAFEKCSNLTAVSFPESLTNISDYAFGNTNLTEVINFNPEPIFISDQVFADVDISACTLKVPASSVNQYKDAAVWQDFIVEAIVYHTVNFNLNGGEGSIDPLINVISGSKITVPDPDPTKADFTFGGWWKNEDYADYTKRWNFDNDVVTDDITLYAKWIDNNINTYTVTFDSKGGNAVNAYLGIEENSTIAEPAAPTRTGYTFAGWWKDTDYMTTSWNFETDHVTADLTLYAKWDLKTYTVTFDAQGGSAVDNITNVAHGTTITAPDPDPAKTGYAFLYWSQNNPETTDMPEEWNFATNKVMNNITLYAVWEADYFQITFDYQYGGGGSYGSMYEYNTLVEEPKEPTRVGYTFGGWYKEPECITLWNFATDRVTGDATIYAKWTIRTYYIAFNTMGGSSIDTVKDVTHGSSITAPTPNPTKENFIFEGWYRESECTNKWSFSDNVVTSNLTLYANWVSVDVPTFTVTFNSMSGSPIAAAEGITSGSLIQNPGSPTRTGYTFIGWYKDENGTTPWNFNTDQVTANLTLYAKWAANTYTVTFNSKGGSPVSPLTEVAHGSTITAPTAPTKANHTFGGWHKDDGCTLAWAFDVDVIISNTTLYAKWTENSTVVAVTGISLDKTGITLTVGELEQLEAIIAPSNATNQNVTWSSSAPAVAAVTNGLITAVSVGTASIIAKTVDGNFTDTCKVTVNVVTSKPKYTVTISEPSNGTFTVKNNGVLVSSGDEIDSATVLTLQASPNAGYKFSKWHDNDTNANRTITLKSDLTISATFEETASAIVGRETEEGLKIYPNPVSNGVFFVEIPKLIETTQVSPSSSNQIQIYDFNGKLVLQQSITGKTTEVNISHLPNGTYVVKIGNNSMKMVKR